MFRSPLADGIVVVLVILLVFGPKRLPMLSRSIGESIKEFKGGITSDSDDKHLDAARESQTSETTDKRESVA